MTPRKLIEFLEKADQSIIVPHGFPTPHSYRGYYEDLAFAPAENVSIASMLAHAKSAMGKTFTGYKGGEFTMGEYTDCWLSEYSMSSQESISEALLSYMIQSSEFEMLKKVQFNTGFLLGVEFGFKQGEKGRNIEHALDEAQKVLAPKTEKRGA